MLSGAGAGSASGVQIIAPGESTGAGANPDNVAEPTLAPVEAVPATVEIAVYVTGEVQRPGVYRVPEGQRLTDVIDLAGGPTDSADLNRINLAAYVADAGHYRIPAVGESEQSAGIAGSDAGATDVSQSDVPQSGAAPAAAACATPVDINTATADCLQTLPGIGAVRAQSIVAHREQAGPFAAAAGIMEVSGIGEGIYGRIADMITVGSR